jgi:hypothetical protein
VTGRTGRAYRDGMRLRSRLLVWRAGILLRAANRRRRRRLIAELADYRTPAEIDDLWALLESYPPGQTQELRDILAGQQLRTLAR